jgi:hypothetical protein
MRKRSLPACRHLPEPAALARKSWTPRLKHIIRTRAKRLGFMVFLR